MQLKRGVHGKPDSQKRVRVTKSLGNPDVYNSSSNGRVVRASASGAVDSGLILGIY